MQDSSLGSIQIVITLHVWKELHYYWMFSPPSGKWDINCAPVYSVKNKHLFHRGFCGAANLPVLLQVITKNYLGFVKVGWANLLMKPTRECPTSVLFDKLNCTSHLVQQSSPNWARRTEKVQQKGPNWMGDCPSLHPQTIQLSRLSLAHSSFVLLWRRDHEQLGNNKRCQ